jgi:D-arabinose 1-dehydrogenase-like Zn-dependent alcohol dehydrogenase
VVHQGRARAGEWVAVHGCGGVGLSAAHIAVAAGARVIAVDVSAAALSMAADLGADVCLRSYGPDDELAGEIVEITGGGAHLSLDAFGSAATCVSSVSCLRARGRHVQVGLLPPSDERPAVPMDRVLALELELRGSHGMAAHAYPELLALVSAGRLSPQALVTRELSLGEAGPALAALGSVSGMAVVTSF